ncbi:helix-turn-helix domain-containing protein [Xanthomonas tesorieronis]|uniref:helix-turn-helix domain-containing protein n=1 Tax=Xanthomonas tesorieronis TaxID=3160839 RepID=UPI003515A571
MKQVELARRLNISTSYLNEIEHGKKAPSLALLDEYSKIFKVPASTFLLFKERAGGVEAQENAHAKRLLKFFEWVSADEDESDAEESEAAPAQAGEAKEAVFTRSVRAVRN